MPARADRLEAALRRAASAAAWTAGALVLVSAVLVTLDVATRAVFGRVVFESFELSGYAFAIVVALALAATVTDKANVRVDTINALLPRTARVALDVLGAVTLAAFAVVLAWQTAQVAVASARMGARSNSSLALPLAWPQGIWALGIAFFALVAIVFALRAIGAAARRDWAGVDRVAGLRATQSADAERDSV